MPTALLKMSGRTSTFSVRAEMSWEQIKAMNDDDIEIGILENTAPEWVVDFGLLSVWCFIQDIWSFKNPWRY